MAPNGQNLDVSYNATVQHWIHAEQTRWTLLYNYFMGSSILILAWGSVFAAKDDLPYRRSVLICLAVCGLLISVIWILLGHRANGFVHAYSVLGQKLEKSLAREPGMELGDFPFTTAEAHRSNIARLAKVCNSRFSVVLVPSLFASLYLILLVVAIGRMAHTQQAGTEIRDTVQRSVMRGPESIAFYAFIFAALYALLDSILNFYDWFSRHRLWLRVILKVLVFCILFLLIMASPWIHNLLSTLLGWLEVEH